MGMPVATKFCRVLAYFQVFPSTSLVKFRPGDFAWETEKLKQLYGHCCNAYGS